MCARKPVANLRLPSMCRYYLAGACNTGTQSCCDDTCIPEAHCNQALSIQFPSPISTISTPTSHRRFHFSRFPRCNRITICLACIHTQSDTMSFGFSVGDMLHLIELAQKTRRSFIDAPAQFRQISEEYHSHRTVSVESIRLTQKSELERSQMSCATLKTLFPSERCQSLSLSPLGTMSMFVPAYWRRYKQCYSSTTL